MRILMVAPEPFFEPRGTPLSVYQRLWALSALGHEVDLVTYFVGSDVRIPGVRIYRIPRLPFIHEVKVGPSLVKPILDLLLFGLTLTLLLRRGYEVIHSHEEASFFCSFLAPFFHARHLYDMHSSLPKQMANFGYRRWNPLVMLFELLERWVLHTCDAVITIGEDLEHWVTRINPNVRHIRVENLPLFTDESAADDLTVAGLRQKLGLEGKRPIVYTGTFEPYQGLGLLLECARTVTARNPRACFVMVGGKPHQIRQWQQEAKRLQVEEHVQFVGIVPPEEAVGYLRLADIVVSPRIAGTSVPLKIYSYLYSGKPIVATDLFAHTQVLNNEVACLVEPTAVALADGILRLLEDPELGARLGRRALALAKSRYNHESYLDKMKQVYQPSLVLPDLLGRSSPVVE